MFENEKFEVKLVRDYTNNGKAIIAEYVDVTSKKTKYGVKVDENGDYIV